MFHAKMANPGRVGWFGWFIILTIYCQCHHFLCSPGIEFQKKKTALADMSPIHEECHIGRETESKAVRLKDEKVSTEKSPARESRHVKVKCHSNSEKTIGWILENACVWFIVLLRKKIGTYPRDQIFKNAILNFLGAIVTVEGSVALQLLVSETIYKDVPYFSHKNKFKNHNGKVKIHKVVKDWLSCNAVTHIITSTVVAYFSSRVNNKVWKALDNRPFRLLSFLKKLLVVRLVVDASFFFIHRCLHVKRFGVYKYIHKKHHEHYQTNLTTNFHFTVPDLLFEGFIPTFLGVLALRLLAMKSSRLELYLYSVYINWYEIGSHLGKDIPIISFYPPISILYHQYPLLRSLDSSNIAFHELHHNQSNVNYGITQWMDYIFSSRKMY